MKPIKLFGEEKCEELVNWDFFCIECSHDCIIKALENIKEIHPNYFVKIGITHNPCYRFTSNAAYTFIPAHIGIKLKRSLVDYYEEPLNEERYEDDYEKMYVICSCDNENEIKEQEIIGVTTAKVVFGKDKVLNLTEGGNGNIKVDQDHYFLYACVTTKNLIKS